MSADNYNYVDTHPDNPPDRRYSVTNGFVSDDEVPSVPNGSTRWFSSWQEAWKCADEDWTEYGATLSRALQGEVFGGA